MQDINIVGSRINSRALGIWRLWNIDDMNLFVPPLSSRCNMTVVIPARDEEESILRCLQSLAVQHCNVFDVIVFANNCTDGTADVTRRFARTSGFPLYVIESTLTEGVAHVGTARQMLMNCAARRFAVAGRTLGVIATTDADTVVAADWVDQTFKEMRCADAVAGFVEIAASDQQAMFASVRLLYARETAFRQAWTDFESLVDPLLEDPAPRHGAFVGASLAVSAAIYEKSGGLPAVRCLEDRAFLGALRRIDARIRHSLDVRAWTSGRRIARVVGGFGTFISHLHEQGVNGHTFLVENPHGIIDEVRARAALRRIWKGLPGDDDIDFAADSLGVTSALIHTVVDRSLPFGTTYERLCTLACSSRGYSLAPVDEAIEVLRAAAASLNALAPTRRRTASGAG